MKKKRIFFLVFSVIIICLTGCQESENYKMVKESKGDLFPIYEQNDSELQGESALQTLQDVYKSGYEFEEWKVKDIEEPGGILVLGENIVVSDKGADCVLKVDGKGNLIGKAGKTGNGEGEFISPSAITLYDHEIYVLDQGNNRVQVLDEDLGYEREIKLKDNKKEDPDYIPQNIAVNQEGVYVTGLSLRTPKVELYRTGEEAEEIAPNFIGSMSVYDDKVYFINSMAQYYEKDTDSFGAASLAPAWIVMADNKKMEKLCELPYGFNIAAFLANKSGFICASRAGGGVYSLNKEGAYEETIAYLPGLEDEEAPQMAIDDEERIYIAMPQAKKIYRCYK